MALPLGALRAPPAGCESRLARIERRLAVLTWMVGASLALTLAVLLRVSH